MAKRGKLILFGGPEGSGKSVQANLLAERLRNSHVPVLLTREPGGTDVGNRVRGILLDTALHGKVSGWAELFLFQAARAQLNAEIVKPALEAGTTVIKDRSEFCTVAYQHHGRGLPLEPIVLMNEWATLGMKPDLVFVLDLNLVAVGLERKGTVLSGAKEVTRFELEALDFHQRVRDGYLALALDHPWWQVVDASQSVEAVHEKIWPLVAKLHQLA